MHDGLSCEKPEKQTDSWIYFGEAHWKQTSDNFEENSLKISWISRKLRASKKKREREGSCRKMVERIVEEEKSSDANNGNLNFRFFSNFPMPMNFSNEFSRIFWHLKLVIRISYTSIGSRKLFFPPTPSIALDFWKQKKFPTR